MLLCFYFHLVMLFCFDFHLVVLFCFLFCFLLLNLFLIFQYLEESGSHNDRFMKINEGPLLRQI